MITLRGHHLLCILTYSGKGYTPEFTRTLDDICVRLSAGEEALLTWRPDSICQPVLDQPDCHCRQARIVWRDIIGFINVTITLRRWLWPGRKIALTAHDVARLRRAFRDKKRMRLGCIGCEWFDLCTQTAQSGYVGSIFPLK